MLQAEDGQPAGMGRPSTTVLALPAAPPTAPDTAAHAPPGHHSNSTCLCWPCPYHHSQVLLLPPHNRNTFWLNNILKI